MFGFQHTSAYIIQQSLLRAHGLKFQSDFKEKFQFSFVQSSCSSFDISKKVSKM